MSWRKKAKVENRVAPGDVAQLICRFDHGASYMGADVIIAGAGPTGLSTALELVRLGACVRIFDTAPAPTTESRATGILPHTLDLLEASGATQQLIAAGIKLKGFNIINGGLMRGGFDATRLKHPYNFMLSLPQSQTEAILTQCLAAHGVKVERGRAVKTFTSNINSVEVDVTELNERITAGWLVGADGAHSTIRKALNINFPGAAYPFEWTLADVEILGEVENDRGEMVLEVGTPLLLRTPIGSGQHRLIANGPDVLKHASAYWKIGKISWQSSYRVSHRMVERLGEGRIWLVGDAAHIQSPAGGRGMNLGIEDGVTLARCIAAGELDDWAAKRHARAKETIRESDIMQRFATADGFVARSLSPKLLELLLRVRPLHDLMINRLAGAS
jgi:2-polyprenyl-6-methoxyphenol hydroxylase-like FAD-dependent oxidoreductase